jgi:hypothetical protein
MLLFAPSNKVISQGLPDLHDSIFLRLFIKDSIDRQAMLLDTNSSIQATVNNPCLISNNEEYKQKQLLYDLSMPYSLIFYDEFNSINHEFWNVIDDCNSECWQDRMDLSGDCESSDEKIQYWEKENVNIERENNNSYLRLTARFDPANRFNNTDGKKRLAYYKYTSGFIHSKKAFPYDAGVFQARIRLPKNIDENGLQPAFWLMSQGPDPWHEIDIFEFFDSDNKLTMTHHINPAEIGHNNKEACRDVYRNYSGIFNDWIVYTCYWNKFATVIFIDYEVKNLLGNTIKKSKVLWERSHFLKSGTRKAYKNVEIKENEKVDRKLYYPTRPMRLMLNLYTYLCDEKRKNDRSYIEPSYMDVDWVKIWYKQPCHQDITISDCSKLINLDSRTYNFFSGKNVTIDCDAVLPQNIHLKIAHSGTLKGEKRLEVGVDGYLEANPEPDICSSTPPNQDPMYLASTGIKNIEVINKGKFIIKPNPANNHIIISRLDEDNFCGTAKIELFTPSGVKILERTSVFNASESILQLSIIPGYYFIKITNPQMNGPIILPIIISKQ